MIINTHIHASTTAADFAPAIWPLKATETFSLAFEKNRSVIVFLSHDQMIELRDVLTEAIANSPLKCGVRGCEESRVTNCENCDANARLIASAPNMLAALKRVAREDDRATGRDFLVGQNIMQAVKNAIEEAEGRT